METVKIHKHSFDPGEWPFQDPVNTAVISTRQVFRLGYPILRVCHDTDGDWQILCGTTNDTSDAMVVCLGCAYQKDRTIGSLADLPTGWAAYRKKPGSKWIRERREEEPEDL